MPITRRLRNADLAVPTRPDKGACLNCPDCAGLCWSILELSRVPDQVLRPNRSMPA